MQPGYLLVGFLLACALAGCAAQSWEPRNGTEMSCSIIVWGSQDYFWTGPEVEGPRVKYTPPPTEASVAPVPPSDGPQNGSKGSMIPQALTDYITEGMGEPEEFTSHCLASIPLARERCGGQGINFVPTMFWKYYVDDVTRMPDRYCYKTNFGDDQVPVVCEDLVDWYPENRTHSDRLIHQYFLGMKACFISAIEHGFTNIKITPHLDDGTGSGGWRNLLGLDPWIKQHGYSYVDIMISPLARAMREAIIETESLGRVTVKFTLQGEMNWALVAFPDKWQGVAGRIREWVSGASPLPDASGAIPPAGSGNTTAAGNSTASQDGVTRTSSAEADSQQQLGDMIKVGVSLNFNKLCGADPCNPGVIVSADGALINQTAFVDLLWGLDYIGISHYPRLDDANNPAGWEWETPITTLATELAETFQFSLTEYLAVEGKEFHLSEFGIGGGNSQCGCQAAPTVEEMAYTPWFGMFGIHGHFQDPWAPDWAKEFQARFYESSIRWLSTRGGPTYRVDGAYQWSMSSWDVSGIYWTSLNKTTNGSYYNPAVMTTVRNYNDERIMP